MNKNCSQNETYFELFCLVPNNQEELWSWFCFENGALGVETLEENSSTCKLRIFFKNQPLGGGLKLLKNFNQQYSPINKIQILDEKTQQNENWQANWREFFTPVKVGESLIILPSWEKELELHGRKPIWIDPGQGFGTGHHASTALALEMLENYLLQSNNIPTSMIDVGIGSGILAIAACRLGIPEVIGVDIEYAAIQVVQSNSEINQLSRKIKALHGQPSLLKKPAPLVISNMLFSELHEVRLELVRLTSVGGSLICSGLWNDQDNELRKVKKMMAGRQFVY